MSKEETLKQAFYNFFYSKNYDTQLQKNARELSDELWSYISHHMKDTQISQQKQEDEYCTIGGIRYKMEKIK